MLLGYHVRKTDKSIIPSIKESLEVGSKHGFDINYVQIYVIGPNNSYEILTTEEKKELKELNINILVHGSHLDHILGNKHKYTVMNIKRELNICREIKAIGLIIHIPNKKASEIANALDEIMYKEVSDIKIYLEMDNYNKDVKYKYTEISNLKKLFKLISEKEYAVNIGLGIDTAHLWTSGVNIEGYKDANKWLSQLSKINTRNIILQLNDQKWDYGSGSDEHQSLTYGTIWTSYNNKNFNNIKESGLMAFIEWAIDNKIITILERKTLFEIEKDLLVLSMILN
mgnify:CR=1 FL=1